LKTVEYSFAMKDSSMKPTVLIVASAFLLSGCELAFAPISIPFNIQENRAAGEELAIQPVKVLSPSGKTLAEPKAPARVVATYNIARSAIVCTIQRENDGGIFDLSRPGEDLSCNRGWKGSYSFGATAYRYDESYIRLDREGNGSNGVVGCKIYFQGKSEIGSVQPFGFVCTEWSSEEGADTVTRKGAAKAARTSETTHSYTFWINPAS
jgi:hypothetical protein